MSKWLRWLWRELNWFHYLPKEFDEYLKKRAKESHQ